MIYMGDECGRTQRGNNNAYCQDEDWNWFDWSLTEKNGDLLQVCEGNDCVSPGQPRACARLSF